jgi:hypothetical protein
MCPSGIKMSYNKNKYYVVLIRGYASSIDPFMFEPLENLI